MKGYVEQLERLGYVLPQDFSVGLIMNGLTSDFAEFVKNYNMHNMRKTIGELHALLIEYDNGLPKKAATPQVILIQVGRIQKANKKSLNAKGKGKGKGNGKDKPLYILKPKNPKRSAKEHLAKDDACYHYKEVGHWKRNCLVYFVELIKKKKKQVGTASCNTPILKNIAAKANLRAVELEEIQDTSPFENTSKIPIEVEGFEPPQKEVVPVRRSARTHRALDRLCLNIEVEEHSLGEFNEPTNYKVALLDPKSNKWLDAMNAEMQSMKDNQVWCLVDLPLNSKGFTQTYRVDYKETFSPVADIRAIRILVAITTFYDYEIWQMDVKNAFLNGYLDEDICMVQYEGFVDHKHPRKVCDADFCKTTKVL
nr:hypothetical protein [Tanacetum cinerariifolium]